MYTQCLKSVYFTLQSQTAVTLTGTGTVFHYLYQHIFSTVNSYKLIYIFFFTLITSGSRVLCWDCVTEFKRRIIVWRNIKKQFIIKAEIIGW